MRNYAKKHKEQRRIYLREWHRQHREAGRAAWHNRRARMQLGGGKVTAAEFASKRAEYSGVCPYCGRRIGAGHVDHIVPLAMQGPHEADNLAFVCASCNSEKKDMKLLEFLALHHPELAREKKKS